MEVSVLPYYSIQPALAIKYNIKVWFVVAVVFVFPPENTLEKTFLRVIPKSS